MLNPISESTAWGWGTGPGEPAAQRGKQQVGQAAGTVGSVPSDEGVRGAGRARRMPDRGRLMARAYTAVGDQDVLGAHALAECGLEVGHDPPVIVDRALPAVDQLQAPMGRPAAGQFRQEPVGGDRDSPHVRRADHKNHVPAGRTIRAHSVRSWAISRK